MTKKKKALSKNSSREETAIISLKPCNHPSNLEKIPFILSNEHRHADYLCLIKKKLKLRNLTAFFKTKGDLSLLH